MTVIQALHRLSQEDCHEFQASQNLPKKEEKVGERKGSREGENRIMLTHRLNIL